MAFRSSRQSAAGSSSPAIRAYGALFVLLLASTLLGRFVGVGAEVVSDLRFVASVVNAALGLAVLAAGYAAYRHWPGAGDGLDLDELLQLGGATGLVLFVVAYRLQGGADLPLVGGQLGTSLLTAAVAMALPAFVYADLQGVDVRVAFPARGALPAAGVTVLGGALAGAAWVVTLVTVGGWDPVFPFGGAFGPRLSAGVLVRNVLVPGALVGLGMGVLYNGAVQEGLRERLGPAGAVAAATALVGGSFVAAPSGPLSAAVATAVTTAAVVALSLLAALAAARAVRVVPPALGVEPSPALAASFGVFVVLVPLVVVWAVGLATWALVPAGGSVAVVAAVACVGYERSRSVWVPALAFASYLVVADANVAAHLAAVLG